MKKQYTKLKTFVLAAALPAWVFGPLWLFLTHVADFSSPLICICVIPLSLPFIAEMVLSLVFWWKEVLAFVAECLTRLIKTAADCLNKLLIKFLAFVICMPAILLFIGTPCIIVKAAACLYRAYGRLRITCRRIMKRPLQAA